MDTYTVLEVVASHPHAGTETHVVRLCFLKDVVASHPHAGTETAHRRAYSVRNSLMSRLIPMRGRKRLGSLVSLRYRNSSHLIPMRGRKQSAVRIQANLLLVTSHPHAGTETCRERTNFRSYCCHISSPCGDGNLRVSFNALYFSSRISSPCGDGNVV